MKAFFFFDLNQNNVIADLADTAPGNDILTFTSGKEAESAGTRHDQCGDPAGFAVKFQIDRAPEAAAGAGVDYFFLSKFT